MNERLKKLHTIQKQNQHMLSLTDASGSDGCPERNDTQGSESSVPAATAEFNMTGSSFRHRPTLAQSLKQRRGYQEAIESERSALGLLKKSFTGKYTALKQTDEKGSAIRIRPETPKVNLLELQQRR